MRRTTSPVRTFNSRVIICARASRARVQEGGTSSVRSDEAARTPTQKHT